MTPEECAPHLLRLILCAEDGRPYKDLLDYVVLQFKVTSDNDLRMAFLANLQNHMKYVVDNMAGVVRIKTSKENFEGSVTVPKGEPENFMTDAEARSKFDDLVDPYLSEHQRDALVKEILQIEKSSSVDAMLDLTYSNEQGLRMAGED